jgi:putative ABC transport system permease protein
MWKLYIISAIRHILKNKWTSLINIVGLAIGLASSILIFLWIQDELKYDNFHSKKGHIFKITSHEVGINDESYSDVSPLPALPYILNNYPEVTMGTRILHVPSNVEYNDNAFSNHLFFAVDTSFFNLFDFPIIKGDPSKPFLDNSSIIISKSISEILFDTENPLGKVIKINGDQLYKVSAVIDYTNLNTSFSFDFLVPYDFSKTIGYDPNDWNRYTTETFLLLNEKVNLIDVKAKIKNVYLDNKAEDDDDNTNYYVELQPLSKIRHFLPSGKMGKMLYIYIFGVMAIFILVIACINFINLSIAHSTNRTKEVGLKKVVGAQKNQLIWQYLTESILLVFISFHLAIILVELLRPAFNTITNKNIALNYLSGNYIIASILIIGITSFLAGLYPSIILSSFKPIQILKRNMGSSKKGISLRKVLVVFQFFISSALIIGSIIIYLQLSFIQGKNIGIQKDHIIYFRTNNIIHNNFDHFKNKLKANNNIIEVTRTFQVPSFYGIGMGASWEGFDDYINVDVGIADDGHLNTFGIQLLEGRNFDPQLSSDTASILINETAAKLFKENPIGKKLELVENGIIIGIVKDYHYRPLNYPIIPMALLNNPSKFSKIAIRYKKDTESKSIDFVENIYKEFCPNYTFEYDRLIDDFDYFYRDENRLIKLVQYFTILGIIISCLGLLGLSAFMAQKRTKEIGIRKVNGATINHIFNLLNKDFLKLVGIGFIISCPVTYYILQQWLNKFIYHTEISIWVFAFAGIVSLMVAFITISIYAYKSSVQNPIDSLRYE